VPPLKCVKGVDEMQNGRILEDVYDETAHTT
jgi:hypothetical protein